MYATCDPLYWVCTSGGTWTDPSCWSCSDGGPGGDGVPSYPTQGCQFTANSIGTDGSAIDASGATGCGGTGGLGYGGIAHTVTLSLGAAHLTLGGFTGLFDSRSVFTIDAGTSLVELDDTGGGANATLNAVTFYDLQFDAGTYSVGDGATVTHALTLAPGATVSVFEDVTLTTAALSCGGSSGSPITISGGSHTFTIASAAQPLCTHANVDHSTAQGTLPFADSTGTDNGNNTSWCFSGPCTAYTPTPTPTPIPAGCCPISGNPFSVVCINSANLAQANESFDTAGCQDLINGFGGGTAGSYVDGGSCVGGTGNGDGVCTAATPTDTPSGPTDTPTDTPTATPTATPTITPITPVNGVPGRVVNAERPRWFDADAGHRRWFQMGNP